MYYVFSDVHGRYDLMLDALKEWDKENEKLIILGDLIDRGEESLECVRLAMYLKERHGAVVLRGNHEEMFVNLANSVGDMDSYFGEFMRPTFKSFFKDYCDGDVLLNYEGYFVRKELNRLFEEELAFMEKMPLFYEVSNVAFVHAGIDMDKYDWRIGEGEDFLWIREEFLFDKRRIGKKIIFGHTSTRYLNADGSNGIWISGEKIGIDGGCSMGGQLNAIRVSKEGEILEELRFR